LNGKRSELVFGELKAVALRLFEVREFNAVTVQDIAAEAKISVRTFYRYLPAKEDVLHVAAAVLFRNGLPLRSRGSTTSHESLIAN